MSLDFTIDDPKPQPPQPLGRRVPNHFPSVTNQPYRIAIVGEAPGKDEEYVGQPFVGYSGRLLTNLLSKASIIRDACFIGNVCQYRPPNNDISVFSREGSEISDGLESLSTDLARFDPNVVLLLGKTAFWAAKGQDDIGNWRGSFFISNKPGPFYGRKCLASYHPAACLRQYEWTPLLMMDIQKVKADAQSKDLVLPLRDLIVNPTLDEILCEIQRIENGRLPVSVDIEGGLGSMSCVSLATSGSRSLILPLTTMDGSSYWQSESEEELLWLRFAHLMSNSAVPKIFQNGLYDRFVLQYGYSIPVLGNADDTMLKFWEQYAELEKSLGFQCSILTKEPFYKHERKSDDRETHYRYCCRDSATTFEINEKLEAILSPDQKQHYHRNIELLNPLLYMELRGISYDSKKAKERKEEVDHIIYGLQADLDRRAGFGLCPDARGYDLNSKEGRQALMALVRETLCWKRDPTRPKAGHEEEVDYCIRVLLGEGELTDAQIGRIETALNLHINIDSPKQVKDFLYKKLGLPEQHKKGKRGEEPKLTSDFEALLKLKRKVTKDSMEDRCLTLVIDIGQLLTRSSLLSIKSDPDHRVRTGYNLVGTETGRIASYTSPTGSGYNLQTITAGIPLKPEGHPLRLGMRDLFLADEGHYLFQCDLSGADGWTVGAYMAMLGDPTMLDDLKARLKPAAVICYILRHGADSVHNKSREELKEMLKEVKKEDWDYFACKQGIWGTCYTMGPDKLATTIAKRSQGTLWLSRREVEDFQNAVFQRYHVRIWHQWMAGYLKRNNMTLIAPNGFKRKFFAREDDALGQALAHMPQVITTYATNTAMFRLWTDSENRFRSTKPGILSDNKQDGASCLRIEPLHQVHDALIGQFKIDDTAWAIGRLKSYFDNPITIAGQTITIPFDGAYGTSWGMLDKGTI